MRKLIHLYGMRDLFFITTSNGSSLRKDKLCLCVCVFIDGGDLGCRMPSKSHASKL